MKTDFKSFRVGTVFNPLKIRYQSIKPVCKNVRIKFPSRLNAMALDPAKITSNSNLIYTPGELVFCVNIYNFVEVRIINKRGCIGISEGSKRKSLIKHAGMLMRKSLNFKEGLWINVDNKKEIRHCGLGSSSRLIASVACAINELYGNPVNCDDLVKYVAQNHGEEIDGKEDLLMPVQCIGGSAAAGMFNGGVLVIAGESCVIKTMDVSPDYDVVIGIPMDYKELDSKVFLEMEIKNFDKFLKTGQRYGSKIAYNILHSVLPAMVRGDLKTIGDIVFDYRFNIGSIKNCSYCYPKLPEITDKLAYLKIKGIADVLAISSVGPGIFAITKKSSMCVKAFKKVNLKTFVAKIENKKYSVLERKTI